MQGDPLASPRYPPVVGTQDYDPFGRGPYAVRERGFEALDTRRGRRFPSQLWYPAQGEGAPAAGPRSLIVFSHFSGGNRRSSSFLCTHLASHGYVVAALDHSEVVAPELARQARETPEDQAARIGAIIGSRVPDVQFLLDYLLGGSEAAGDLSLDADAIGVAGHSFGGWTALAVPEADQRVRAVAAFAPGGNVNPKPGILPLKLSFDWNREVPALYLAAENDVSIPPEGVIELFERTPATKAMFILRRADHQHFVDDVEAAHEAVRAMSLPGSAAWIPAAMRPISELCTGEQAHLFVNALTLSHFDVALRELDVAREFLAGDVLADLAARGVDAIRV